MLWLLAKNKVELHPEVEVAQVRAKTAATFSPFDCF